MRICKNKITDELRNLFNANPLRVPESSYIPLGILEIKNKRPQIIGEFSEMIKGDFNHVLEIKTSDVAEIEGTKSKKVGLSIGLDILGNFIKSFGFSPAGIQTAFNNTHKLSFSFSNVKRRSFSPLALGKILSENEILGDPKNIFINKILRDKSSKLAVVTDTIVSNNFSVSTYDERDNSVEIDIPSIDRYLSDVAIGVSTQSTNSNEIKFVKDTPLTFAFCCVEIFIDENGRFTRGEWLNKLKARSMSEATVLEYTDKELDHYSKLLLDEDENRPLLIE